MRYQRKDYSNKGKREGGEKGMTTCHLPCEYKRDAVRLRKRVEMLESGLEVEKLQRAIDQETKSKLRAMNELDRLRGRIEEEQKTIQNLKVTIAQYKDQLIWMEEERNQERKEASEKIKKQKKRIDELEKELSTAAWKLEKQKKEQEKQHIKELKQYREEQEKIIADLTAKYQAELSEKDAVIEFLKKNGSTKEEKKTTPEVKNTRINSGNSSVPPSQDPNHPPIVNNRIPSGRKPGAQKGHEYHPRKQYQTEQVVKLPDPQEVIDHPEQYYVHEEFTKQVISIRLTVGVITYVGKIYRNRETRAVVKSPLPEGVGHLEVNYDETVDSIAAFLHSVCHVPYNKIHEFLYEATDGMLNISTGKLVNLEKKFSELSEEERAQIAKSLFCGDIMHIDGTSARIDGKQRQILILGNEKDVLYTMTGVKGDAAIEGTPAEHYQGTIVSDSESTFTKLGGRQQRCCVHEGRYLHRAEQDTPDLQWSTQMKELLQSIQHRRNIEMAEGKTCMGPSEQLKVSEQYDSILRTAVEEYRNFCPELFEKHPILSEGKLMEYDGLYSLNLTGLPQHSRINLKKDSDICPDMAEDALSQLVKDINLLFRLMTSKKHYLLFLEDYSIPPHNNEAEKLARCVKIHFKPNGGMRSEAYAGYYADTASVLESENRKGGSRFKKLMDVFKRAAGSMMNTFREAGKNKAAFRTQTANT